MEGTSIGQYRLLRKIGEGGMGAVFLGEHTLLGRRAAIKVLLPELSAHRTNVDRFFNEALATTSVSDPGIVQVFDFGYTPDQTAYIVMEYLEGEQLDSRLSRMGSLLPSDALRFTRQVAGALAAAHARGIVHRDIKPANLFIVRDSDAANGERAKILDFGIAKLGKEVSNRIVTMTGQVIGTPLFMSPEQCNGTTPVDQRSDIYSLGCVMFMMLTGRPPFAPKGIAAVMSAHLYDPPPALSKYGNFSPELDDLVVHCLAKSPDDRFANMFELQRACDAVIAKLVTSGSSLDATAPLLPPPTARLSGNAITTLSGAAAQPSGAIQQHRRDFWVKLSVAAAAIGIASAIGVTLATTHDQLGLPAPPRATVAPFPDASSMLPPSVPSPSVVPAPSTPPTNNVEPVNEAQATPSTGDVRTAPRPAASPHKKSNANTEHHDREQKQKVNQTKGSDDLYEMRN